MQSNYRSSILSEKKVTIMELHCSNHNIPYESVACKSGFRLSADDLNQSEYFTMYQLELCLIIT